MIKRVEVEQAITAVLDKVYKIASAGDKDVTAHMKLLSTVQSPVNMFEAVLLTFVTGGDIKNEMDVEQVY